MKNNNVCDTCSSCGCCGFSHKKLSQIFGVGMVALGVNGLIQVAGQIWVGYAQQIDQYKQAIKQFGGKASGLAQKPELLDFLKEAKVAYYLVPGFFAILLGLVVIYFSKKNKSAKNMTSVSEVSTIKEVQKKEEKKAPAKKPATKKTASKAKK